MLLFNINITHIRFFFKLVLEINLRTSHRSSISGTINLWNKYITLHY